MLFSKNMHLKYYYIKRILLIIGCLSTSIFFFFYCFMILWYISLKKIEINILRFFHKTFRLNWIQKWNRFFYYWPKVLFPTLSTFSFYFFFLLISLYFFLSFTTFSYLHFCLNLHKLTYLHIPNYGFLAFYFCLNF